mgnify:CR=1 FL=1
MGWPDIRRSVAARIGCTDQQLAYAMLSQCGAYGIPESEFKARFHFGSEVFLTETALAAAIDAELSSGFTDLGTDLEAFNTEPFV